MEKDKDSIQNLLIETGRKIIQEKGTDALTARKLSEASGCSVGAIYNQFSNMENFIVIQNYITLDALATKLEKVDRTDNIFVDINNFLNCFVDFVLENKNLWYLLHSFHLRNNNREFTYFYLRKVVKITGIINSLLQQILPEMEHRKQLWKWEGCVSA